MSLPIFQENGLLPAGLYAADMSEIEERFGARTKRRKELFERLQHFLELAKHCGALRILVNGSFVTARSEPGDVDVVIWLDERFLELLDNGDEAAHRLKKMFDTRIPREAFLATNELDWNEWVDFFSRVREQPSQGKGLLEVDLI